MAGLSVTQIEVEGHGNYYGTRIELEVVASDANFFYTREVNGLGLVYSHLVKRESKKKMIAWSRIDGRRKHPGRFECDYNYYRAARYVQVDESGQATTKRFPNKLV